MPETLVKFCKIQECLKFEHRDQFLQNKVQMEGCNVFFRMKYLKYLETKALNPRKNNKSAVGPKLVPI